MDNQKGSVKDRLRAFLRFLQYKKKKNKKEKQENKKQKKLEKQRIKAEQIRLYGRTYNKVQVFGLTILGLLIEIFTPKSSKSKVETEIDIIEREIKQIVFKLENDKDLNYIAESIDNTYQKLEDLKTQHKNNLVINSFASINKQSLLENIDKKQKELHVLNDVCKTRESQIKNNDLVRKNITIDDQNNYKKQIKKTEDNISTVEQQQEFELFGIVKNFNEELKEHDKEILKLKDKIDKEKAYSALYDYEFKIKQLKIRLKKLLEQYEFLDEKYELEELNEIIDIEVYDKFELRKDNKGILNNIIECEKLLKNIEDKKQILSDKKNVCCQHDDIFVNNSSSDKLVYKKINEEKTEKKERKKKKIEKDIDDIYLANKIILDNIIHEKKIIDKLKKQIYLQTPSARKKSIFVCAKRFTTSILNFGFSLLPLKYFKSKFIGTLVTGVMLNNSLRSVRRIFNQDVNYLFYQQLLKEICSNQDYIDRTYDICIDSLNQTKNIKNYLNIHYSMLNNYSVELVNFFNQLEEIESKIVLQIKQLENINLDYKKIKRKIKK